MELARAPLRRQETTRDIWRLCGTNQSPTACEDRRLPVRNHFQKSKAPFSELNESAQEHTHTPEDTEEVNWNEHC